MELALSVIIPVYNTASYLPTCIDSLLHQTVQDFELILVDDGSTDDSLSIAQSLLANRPSTRIIHQENHGVSSARNLGIEQACGHYITFIDSDDEVKSDYVQTLLSLVADGDPDFVMTGIQYVYRDDLIKIVGFTDDNWTLKELNKTKYGYADASVSPVAKLYKRSILMKNSIRFDVNMAYAEDRDFNVNYLQYIDNAKSSSYSGYIYRTEVEGSLSKKYRAYIFKNDITYWNKLYTLLYAEDIPVKLRQYLGNRLFYFITDNLSHLSKFFPLFEVYRQFRAVSPLVNRVFLKKNRKLVQAPGWQKMLYFYCPFLLCVIFVTRRR